MVFATARLTVTTIHSVFPLYVGELVRAFLHLVTFSLIKLVRDSYLKQDALSEMIPQGNPNGSINSPHIDSMLTSAVASFDSTSDRDRLNFSNPMRGYFSQRESL